MDALRELDEAIDTQNRRAEDAVHYDNVHDIISAATEGMLTTEDKDITATLCVYSVARFAKGLHIELVSKKFSNFWGKFLEKMKKLDDDTKKQFIFKLSLWTPKNQLVAAEKEFVVGKAHTFYKISQLKMYWGLAEGTARRADQIKQEKEVNNKRMGDDNNSTEQQKKQKNNESNVTAK